MGMVEAYAVLNPLLEYLQRAGETLKDRLHRYHRFFALGAAPSWEPLARTGENEYEIEIVEQYEAMREWHEQN